MLPRLPPTGTQGERRSRTSSSPPTSRPNSWSNPPTRRRSVRRRPLRPQRPSSRPHRRAASNCFAPREDPLTSASEHNLLCALPDRCHTAASPLHPRAYLHSPTPPLRQSDRQDPDVDTRLARAAHAGRRTAHEQAGTKQNLGARSLSPPRTSVSHLRASPRALRALRRRMSCARRSR